MDRKVKIRLIWSVWA